MSMKKAAAYVRMSTDKQEDSPARQRGEIERYAAAHGYEIVEWYEDHGISGTSSKKRKGFQKLMADAPAGRWQFVLMYEQSRFSREDVLQFASHLHQLREAGVTLVTTLKGEIKTDDLGGVLLTMIDGYNARSESATLAHRTTSGKRRKMIDEGKPNGRSIFGYDRVITDAAGNVVQRVPYLERFQKSPSHQERIEISSDAATVDAVRWAFDTFLAGESIRSITREFNDRGLLTRMRKPWHTKTVMYLLGNPVYCGRQRIGFYASGKFARITDEVTERDEAHPAIVSIEKFEAAQTLLSTRRRKGRRNRHTKYILSAVLYCGRCGSSMKGNKTTWGPQYRCQFSTYNERSGPSCQCTVTSELLDNAVWNAIKGHLFSEENLMAADAAKRFQSVDPPSPIQSQIDDLERRIERAGDRIAGDDMDAEESAMVQRKRREWRDELKTMRRSLNAALPQRATSPLFDVSELRKVAKSLEPATHPWELRMIVDAVVEAVTFDRKSPIEAIARIELKSPYYFGPPIVVNSADLYPERLWQKARRLIHEHNRPITSTELARMLDTSIVQAWRTLQKLVSIGALKRHGARRYIAN